MTLIHSFVESANSADTHFPLNNIACGVFAYADGAQCGVAIGDMIFNCTAAEQSGLLKLGAEPLFDQGVWNPLMEAGPAMWAAFRTRITEILKAGSADEDKAQNLLTPMAGATLLMPLKVSEYTDFYAGRHHATNVGTMFRGVENALPPNWLHIPIGYNGRASSVVVSGTDVRRPWGQLKGPNDDLPRFAPCARFDLELELGAIVGQPSDGPISVQEADDNIFGYVLLNDWSARDIQAWEYQPLGPFQAKATATTISPWIVMKDALEPFKRDTPAREFELLDHLKDQGPMLYDIALDVVLTPEGGKPSTIAQTNYAEMYYSSAQQLAHHTTSGCPMRTGDLLGSGTISGPEKTQRGSLLELSWAGKEPLTLDTGETRSFLEDGDTLTLTGAARSDSFTIGFGSCTGKVLPALPNPIKG